jgi:hypothetical protein
MRILSLNARQSVISMASQSESAMDVKEAVALAKQYIAELFVEEKISNLGLEEVEFDESGNTCIITLGFSRPWDEMRNALSTLASQVNPRRTYKVVRISDDSRKILSVKTRDDRPIAHS